MLIYVQGSYSGIGARLFMVGTITAGQFAIYGTLQQIFNTFNCANTLPTGDIKKAIGATGGVEIAK